jgi:hypothetical protein
MKIIRFFKNIKELNGAAASGAGVIGTLGGTCLALIGFLMGLEQRGCNGITLCFQFPALIFCFGMFCFTFFSYLRND